MSTWAFFAVGAGVTLLLLYCYALCSYLKGKGREDIEGAIKAFIVMAANGGSLEIVHRRHGIVLVFIRVEGEATRAELRMRIPFRIWSLSRVEQLQEAFRGTEFDLVAINGSVDWIAEVGITIENIWAVGCARKPTLAACMALDALGFRKDERFNFKHQGKNSWRIMHRP